MKKSLKITFTVVSAAVAVIGAGVLGGTYGSYKNYQALLTIYNFEKEEYGSNTSFDKEISQWNEMQAKLTADQRNDNNKANQERRDNFNKQYTSSDDYVKKNTPSGVTLTQDQINQLKDAYDAQEASFSIDYNYNADQGGVIAGSVLLAIGLVAFIAFLVILLKKKKTV